MFELLALVTGAATNYGLARIHSRQLLMVIYHAPFRFWRPYLALYDRLESRYTYELLGGKKRFGDYQVFQRKYDESRPHASTDFVRLWNTYALQITRNYMVVLLVGLAVFWKAWWVFCLAFFLVQLVLIAHLRFIKHQDADMFVSTMASLLLSRSDVVKTTDDFMIRSEKLL